ncbi:sensor histidine kinase [Candidatus Poriferisocius sp.]|uniref:sensor histidine kinase n=1 Tax=Candidatus Poriferisocius sp. TaxID=3101276 RepID=UPI003B01CFE2
MASLEELAPGLPKSRLNHLKRLMRTWAPLADISFADLLLYVPGGLRSGDQNGEGPPAGTVESYTIAGQIRPTTARSVHRNNLVGTRFTPGQRPLVDVAYREGRITDGGRIGHADQPRIRTLAVPVNCHGEVIAVLAREFDPDSQRNPGELETNYFRLFRRLATMIAEGEYPFPVDDIETEESPRVSDGLMLLDASGRVRLLSPNAASALHRIGLHSNAEGHRLAEIGLEQRAIRAALASRLPQTEEIQQGDRGTLVLRCLPLIGGGEVTGALVLMRDISELRRRDRLLMSKDATIAEIHHRVKNNLQTVSSLLRLQGRRVTEPETRAVIEESVRRIRAIAIVHEILSRDASSEVPFVEIVRSLMRMVEEGLTGPDRPVEFKVTGDAGELDADVATPLAVVINECLQNVVDHAYPDPPGGQVRIELDNDGDRVRVRVIDDGVGLPPGFEVGSADGLGIAIVRSLVGADLRGSISMSNGGGNPPRPGTVVEVAIPLMAHQEVKQI